MWMDDYSNCLRQGDQPSDQLRSGLKQNKVISQVVTMQPGYIWQSRYKNVGFTKHVAVFMDQFEF